MDIILHKAKRIDTDDDILGYLMKIKGEYHIIPEKDENAGYPVKKDTIQPCINKCELKSVQYKEIPYISLWSLIQLGIIGNISVKCNVVRTSTSEEYRNSGNTVVLLHQGSLDNLERKYYTWKVDHFSFDGIFRKILRIKISELN